MKAIGMDIGTTSVCGVVIDTETGCVLNSCTKNSDAFIDGCAAWEKIQSVDKVMATASGILDGLIDTDVSVIGVTGQMHGIVYTDIGGHAVSPLYTWQDERGNRPYRDTTYAGYLGSFSGYGNVTDFYNRENGIRRKDAVSYCTIQDYFVMRLCGLQKPLMHASDAASFGCYNLQENKFEYDCNADVTADYCLAGSYRGIPVSVAVGDNQASVFSTLVDENGILLNVGTGSQVSILVDTVICGEDIEIRPYFEQKFLAVGSALCGGRAYSLLRQFYCEILGYIEDVGDSKVYEIMDEMLQKVEKSSMKVDTRFAGTRKNTGICGSISGITTENFTPASLTRGVLDGIASELFEMYQQMNAPRCGIVGSGNGLRKNPALVKALEDTFGAKIKMPKHMEEAAFGAALFGLVACGAFKNTKEVQSIIQYE